MDNKIKTTHEGEMVLGDNIIPCYVLEDGTRVLLGRGLQQAMHIVDNKGTGDKLTAFFQNKSILTWPVNSTNFGTKSLKSLETREFNLASFHSFITNRKTRRHGPKAGEILDIKMLESFIYQGKLQGHSKPLNGSVICF